MAEKSELTLIEFFIKTKTLFKYFFKKRLWILLISFIGGCIGFFYAQLSKPLYIAELTFVTENEGQSKVNAYAGIASQFGIDLGSSGDGAFQGENLFEMIKSKSIVYNTLFSQINLADTNSLIINEYIINNEKYLSKLKELGYTKFNVSDKISHKREKDSLVGKIYKEIIESKLTIDKIDKKLNFVKVKFIDGNENFAKMFVEEITKNLIEYYTSYKSAKSRINYQLLQREADSLRLVLFGNISSVAQLTDVNVNPLKVVTRTGIQYKQVDVQTTSALYTEVLKNLQISKISLRKETPLIQLIDKPNFPLEKKKPGRLFSAIIFAFGFLIIAFLYYLSKYYYNIILQHIQRKEEQNNLA